MPIMSRSSGRTFTFKTCIRAWGRGEGGGWVGGVVLVWFANGGLV